MAGPHLNCRCVMDPFEDDDNEPRIRVTFIGDTFFSVTRNDFLPEIMCDICKKPVETVIQDYDPITQCTIFKVHCHGDTDTCSFPDLSLYEHTRIVEAVAFKTKRLYK